MFHEENCSKIRKVMHLQNYSIELVKKLIVDRSFAIQTQNDLVSQRQLRTVDIEEKKCGYVGVKYIRSLSENVVKVFKNHNIEVNVAHTRGNSLHPIYNTHKKKYEKRKLNVYKLNCLGGVGKNVRSRMLEQPQEVLKPG